MSEAAADHGWDYWQRRAWKAEARVEPLLAALRETAQMYHVEHEHEGLGVGRFEECDFTRCAENRAAIAEAE